MPSIWHASRLAEITHFQVARVYTRILKALKDGSLDGALIFKNTSLANDVHYVGPVGLSHVLVTKVRGNQPKNYQELAALESIAVIRKAQFSTRFDQDNGLNKVYVESYEQGLKLLRKGRVEAIIGSEVGLRFGMDHLNMNSKVLTTALKIGDKEWWLHLSKKSVDKQHIAVLQRNIDSIYSDTFIGDLYHQQVANGCYTNSIK